MLPIGFRRRKRQRRTRRWWGKGQYGLGYMSGYGKPNYVTIWGLTREEFWMWFEVLWMLAIVPTILSDTVSHTYYLAHCVLLLLLVLSQIGVAVFGFVLSRALSWKPFIPMAITLVLCVLSYDEILDLPAYFGHDFYVAEGYPNFVYNPTQYKTHTVYYDLYVQGVRFDKLPIDYNNNWQYLDKYFVIHYLPKSHVVVDYQITKR